ncbi:hypothetical protein V3C99_006562, partial [Haemonchus contortus]
AHISAQRTSTYRKRDMNRNGHFQELNIVFFPKELRHRAKMEQETPTISMCCLYCRHCVAFVHSRSNTL